MAETTSRSKSFDDRYHFLLRKLHSLSGIVPIGAFLIEHLLTNSLAAGWGSEKTGQQAFNDAVHGLHELPYLVVIEILFIFLPLIFHALYGIKIAMTAEPNVRAYPYMANRRYTLQRVSGYVAFLFVMIHLLKFRFAHWVGWGPEFIGSDDPYAITRDGLNAWTPFGVVIPRGFTFGFYILGLWAAIYHFCNGIWSFCVSWGIAVGTRAQKRVGYGAFGLAVVLLIWGHASLTAFWMAGSEQRAKTIRPDTTAAVDGGVAAESPIRPHGDQ